MGRVLVCGHCYISHRLQIACILVTYIRDGIIVIMFTDRTLINRCCISDVHLLLQKHICPLENIIMININYLELYFEVRQVFHPSDSVIRILLSSTYIFDLQGRLKSSKKCELLPKLIMLCHEKNV